MKRESLLIDYELARAGKEAPTDTQIEDLRDALNTIAGDTIPEFSGIKEASWTLPRGVEVSVTAASRMAEVGYGNDMLASEYEITFRRYHDKSPKRNNYSELRYEICIPAPGSNVSPSAWRKVRHVDPPAQFDADLDELLSNPEGNKPAYSSLAVMYIVALSKDDDREVLDAMSVNDLVLIANTLDQTTEFEEDPILSFVSGALDGAPANNISVASFQDHFEQIAEQGMTKYTRTKRFPVPLQDPDASAYLSIFIDDSEYGSLAEHAKKSIQPEWMVTLVINSPQATHKLQLIRQLNGGVVCHTVTDMTPPERISSAVNEVMKRVLETDATYLTLKSMELSQDLDGANQTQVEFFSKVLEELV